MCMCRAMVKKQCSNQALICQRNTWRSWSFSFGLVLISCLEESRFTTTNLVCSHSLGLLKSQVGINLFHQPAELLGGCSLFFAAHCVGALRLAVVLLCCRPDFFLLMNLLGIIPNAMVQSGVSIRNQKQSLAAGFTCNMMSIEISLVTSYLNGTQKSKFCKNLKGLPTQLKNK